MAYSGFTLPNKKKQDTWGVGDLTAFESLTPSQQSLSSALVSQLQNLLKTGIGGTGFKASYADQFSPFRGDVGSALQQSLLQALSGQVPEGAATPYTGEVGASLQDALIQALSGQVPAEAFKTGIADPTRRAFEEETAPAIREEFAGPGTYWGSARAGKVTGERGRMETGLVEQSARMVEGALNRALQATGPALAAQEGVMGMERSALERALTAQDTAARAQLSSLQMAFEDYARRNPAAGEVIQSMLSYLNIPMMATYEPYEDSKTRTGMKSRINW